MSRGDSASTTSASLPARALAVGAGSAVVAAAAWVVLTAAADGGTTYHLFPLLIGAAGPVATRYVATGPLPRREASIATVASALAWVGGWLVLALLDRWPSSTFLEDQPGGLAAETIVLGLLGAVIGLLYSAFRRSR